MRRCGLLFATNPTRKRGAQDDGIRAGITQFDPGSARPR